MVEGVGSAIWVSDLELVSLGLMNKTLPLNNRNGESFRAHRTIAA